MITVGNKSNNFDFLTFAYEHGVRDFRINMDYIKDASSAFDNIKKLGKDDITIYDDFQGDKFRICLAETKTETDVYVGDKIRFYFAAGSASIHNYITHLEAQKQKLSTGVVVSIADGKLQAEIENVGNDYFETVFTKVDYKLRNNAGLCFLGSGVPTISLNPAACDRILDTLKDSPERIPHWVILSFADSRTVLEKFVGEAHSLGIKVMAKIETPNGVKNMEDISRVVDGLMIGRGDLCNTADVDYPYIYAQALEKLSKFPSSLFKGVGTFFLAQFSETNLISPEELADIKMVFQRNINYFMLSKEVINSQYPYETILKAEELIKGDI
jgi:pyruvate kinase